MWMSLSRSCYDGPIVTPPSDTFPSETPPSETPRSHPMLICQLTDLHVCAVGMSCNRVSETNTLTARAFRAVCALRPVPDVVVITRDLTESGIPAEYPNLSPMIRKYLPMPVYVTPGNHHRRDNSRSALRLLPGVPAQPAYLPYAVEAF